jgi:hypothetical protein
MQLRRIILAGVHSGLCGSIAVASYQTLLHTAHRRRNPLCVWEGGGEVEEIPG